MLIPRILSALVLAPVVLFAAWIGWPLFPLLVALTGVGMIWEWQRMTTKPAVFNGAGGLIAVAMAVAAIIATALPLQALAVVVIAAPCAWVLGKGRWLAIGTLYVGVPVVSLVWIRQAGGAFTLFWLLAVIWATDIGAYAVGRTVGGPKLAPPISPGKTWSGLIGGMISAAVVGLAGGIYMRQPEPWLAGALAAILAVVAQVGDLFESWIKRRSGIKDSSRLIPGHGGLLDRVDGLIAAAPVVALLVVCYKGGMEIWP